MKLISCQNLIKIIFKYRFYNVLLLSIQTFNREKLILVSFKVIVRE